MSKKKHKQYTQPKGMHPFEEEFFENSKPDLELENKSNFFDYAPMLKGDYKEAPNLAPLSLIDIDFSDINQDDFKSGLKKLDARVNTIENINRKLKGAKQISDIIYHKKKKGNPVVDDRMHYASGDGNTHKVIVPGDNEVIIQGASDKKLTPESTGDTLAEVGPQDFKSGLNDFIQQKTGVSALPQNDLQSSIADYVNSKTLNAHQINDMAGIRKSPTHNVIVPEDREVIIEGQGQPLIAKKDQLGEVSGMAPKSSISISTPQPGAYTDESQAGMGTTDVGLSSHTIIVPQEREVLIEGVSKFILSDQLENNEIKSCQYYKGKKLNHMSLIFNNDSALNFNIELFNPSTPVQYLISTRLNLDDKVTIAGGNTTYSEMLFNILANPTMVICAQVVVSSPYTPGTVQDQAAIQSQLNQPMFFKNKNIAGLQAIEPLNVQLQRDIMQYQLGIVYFNIPKSLQRPFVVDGMDTLTYNILAGMTVTICFYYKQVQLKRMVFEECRNAPNLL